MADISKFVPNGNEYNLKDAVARENIGNLTNLETTNKGNLVEAINEVNGNSETNVKESVADDFSASVNYAVGDFCYHLGTLYKCTTAHSAGAWDSTHFTATQVGDELSELKNTLTANTFVDGVLLVSGTPYTCPTDGYVNVYIPTGAEIVVWINSAANFDVKNTSGTGNYHLLYVKKGMIIKATFSDGFVTFRGLIN